MVEGHSWAATSFTEVGEGGEEDRVQVVSRSSESPSATSPSRSPSLKSSVPAHELGPRVSRDPDQANPGWGSLEAAINALGEPFWLKPFLFKPVSACARQEVTDLVV